MSISSTILTFVLGPTVIVAVIAALTLAGDAGKRARRYRPGRPYDFTPIWFLASPDQVNHAPAGPRSGARAQPPAIESGVVETGVRATTTATGGASDRW